MAELRTWPAVRALLISVVLVAQWVDALPLPELRARDLQHPIAQDEVTRWTTLLNDLGVSLTEEELVARALVVGEGATRFRRASMAPLRPLKRLTGTGQSWGLFAYPDPYAGRLVIEAREKNGAWQVLFSAPGSSSDDLSRLMRYRRVRGIYDDNGDRPKPGSLYNRFVDWVAWDLFQSRPDLDAVQVRLDLVRIIPPGTGEGEPIPDKRRHARMRVREPLTKRLHERWSL
ncbi:MAG: hypothetical protein P8R54_11395 [Myxococcota bacterium]|nr:hypothetical protein [Myxococcota bacterium]